MNKTALSLFMFGILSACGAVNSGDRNRCGSNTLCIDAGDGGIRPPVDGGDSVCGESYDPVCGSDGQTYRGGCLAPGAVVRHEGPCSVTECGVGGVCTENYDPVCGVDGQTYSNECHASCMPIAHRGICAAQDSGIIDPPDVGPRFDGGTWPAVDGGTWPAVDASNSSCFEAKPNQVYMGLSRAECSGLKFECPSQTTSFLNDCGCGCAQDPSCPPWIDCMPVITDGDAGGVTECEFYRTKCPFSEVSY